MTKAPGAMNIFAIDPGNVESAVAILSGDARNMRLVRFFKAPNEEVMQEVEVYAGNSSAKIGEDMLFLIEKIASYGMSVGETIFETVFWSGRFAQVIMQQKAPVIRIPRGAVKMQICRTRAAKDANVRQALIDRWGGEQSIRKGGPLYKVSKDVWAALALAVAYMENPLLAETDKGKGVL